MSQQVSLVAESHPLKKALLQNAQDEVPFRYKRVQQRTPDSAIDPITLAPATTGVHTGGQGGLVAPYRVFLMPYCEGPPGSLFWTRLWGWRPTVDTNPSNALWIPVLLCQLACVSGMFPGPRGDDVGPPGNLYLTDMENLCSQLWVVTGSLGSGEMLGGGYSAAAALCDLRGCRLFELEFQRRTGDTITMNCLYARAS
jgi:hypothetical protein